MSGEPVVELSQARLSFGPTVALDGMDLQAWPGQMFGLVGPDGAGKTTAIRVLLGLLPLSSGSARVLGRDPIRDRRELHSQVGYLSQRFTLYGDLTVDENLAFFSQIHRVRDPRPRLARLLALTRLEPFRRRRADALSGGMQKKLALACSLVHSPRVLFLDEPTTGVDPSSRRELWMLLSELLVEGLAVLMATPYLDEAERCGRVALVRAGRTLALDSPRALRASLGVEVIEVVCTPARRARELLSANPRVAEAQLFGDRVHLFARQPGDDLADLLASLPGVEVRSVRRIEPSLEDVYIRRVNEASR